jgi:uncharacterized protein
MQLALGDMYRKGKLVPQNHVEAVKWYRLAAEQGDALAQFNLGAMYSNGRGVPKDLIAACMWFDLSVARGTQAAAGSRKTIARQLSPHQIEQAQQLAVEWKAARASRRRAVSRFGRCRTQPVPACTSGPHCARRCARRR